MDQVTFIILLRRDDQRRRNVRETIQRERLNAEIVPAVDGLELQAGDVESLIRQGYLDPERLGNLKRGQIACALSHLSVLKEVVSRGAARAVVLEDDARLCADFIERLDDALRETPTTFDLLYLYDGNPDSSTAIPDTVRVRASGYPLGTVAYVVSRKGAAKILELIVPIRDHLDEMLAAHVRRGELEAFSAHPPLATLREGFVSQIDFSGYLDHETA